MADLFPKPIPRRMDKKSKPPDRAGANLKICVPDKRHSPDEFRDVLKDNSARKVLRTFTVQSSNPVAGTLTVDFALHEPAGHSPAGDWARSAEPGDLLGYRGPSDKKLTRFVASNYILAADMTALPAIPDSLQVAVIGEHTVVANLKHYFFGEIGLNPDENYISPYWKIGLVEEEHQALKKAERV